MTAVGIREHKKVKTRSRIVDHAMTLFGERGFDAVTVDDIASAADVGKGTVYNYFGAKEDIVVAFLVGLDNKALATIASLPVQGMSVAEALDAAAWSLLEEKPPHQQFVRVAMAQRLTADQPPFEQAQFEHEMDEALAALFERLLARPGMRRSTPIAELVLSFKTMLMGLISLWAIEGPPYIGSRMLTRRHMHLLAKGLEL